MRSSTPLNGGGQLEIALELALDVVVLACFSHRALAPLRSQPLSIRPHNVILSVCTL